MTVFVKPHLAVDADLTKVNYPIWGFPKIDGVRICHLTGSATARTLMPHANLYMTRRFSSAIYKGIDGEGTYGSITSKSLCRDTVSALNTIEGQPNIEWHAFDFLREDVVGLMYKDRYQALVEYVEHYCPDGVKVIPYTVLNSKEEVEAFYEKCLAEGYEGIVLRDPLGLHKNGRCTEIEANYLRMKPSSDKEALVLEIEEAKANLNKPKKNALGYQERSSHKENKVGKGMIGTLICQDVLSGQIIRVGAGKMPHKDRVDFFLHPEKILAKYIKYRSTDTGVKDAPRFGRFISLRAKEDIVFE